MINSTMDEIPNDILYLLGKAANKMGYGVNSLIDIKESLKKDNYIKALEDLKKELDEINFIKEMLSDALFTLGNFSSHKVNSCFEGIEQGISEEQLKNITQEMAKLKKGQEHE